MTAREVTVAHLRARKNADKLVMLTAYTAPVARLADAHVDVLLVGDSLGMVIYGMDSTLGVTVPMMIEHAKAVAKVATHAAVVVDLPFASYQVSPEQAYKSAARILSRSGADAVKLEGGREMASTIEFLTQRGIAVMGHVGLKPQHVGAMGGYRTQGRTQAEKSCIIDDAKAVQDAGAFALVLEGVQQDVAGEVTRATQVPVIGIGASAECDGQVLVVDDMLGLSESTPRFVKRYAELGDEVKSAIQRYAEEVRNGTFPADEHCYLPKS